MGKRSARPVFLRMVEMIQDGSSYTHGPPVRHGRPDDLKNGWVSCRDLDGVMIEACRWRSVPARGFVSGYHL